MAKQSHGEWHVWTDSADPARSVNRSMFSNKRGAKAAITAAESMAIDYGATRVTVHHEGRQAGVFTGAFWVQVTDPTLSRALAAREEN